MKDLKYKIIIPARKNSKGFPFKNRRLLDKTLSIIPENALQNVIITTDDEEIIERALEKNIDTHLRSEIASSDTASTKLAIEECVKDMKIDSDCLIVMLYLTYPNRGWKDVVDSVKEMVSCNRNSLLCKQEPKSHPFLCLYELEDNKGKQLISHDLYRRQDYPKCFELSHYVSAFYVKELQNLNKNMYNKDTYFYEINRVVDVDYEKDLEDLK